MKKIPAAIIASLMLLMLAVPNIAGAASSAWNEAGSTKVRLVSAVEGAGNLESIVIGLHFQMEKNWKIYWRHAGDAGYPPSLKWDGSDNIKSSEMRWPVPVRFSILGFETLGYKDEVVFPINITPEEISRGVKIKTYVDYLACADICVPHEVNLELKIPPGPAAASNEARLINRFASKVPIKGPASGIDVSAPRFMPTGDDPDRGMLFITATSQTGFSGPDVFIEGPDVLSFSKPAVSLDETGTQALLEVTVEGTKSLKQPLAGTRLVLSVADGVAGNGEFAMTVVNAGADTIALGHGTAKRQPDGVSFLLMLGLAVLGGLILNLMPCVLPVLSIKLMSVVGHGGGDKRQVRLSFIASAAGIIASFMLLAGALVFLKSAGAAVGWGIQFQHPWFLITMAMLVTVFAANMFGFFEFSLPGSVSSIGNGTTHGHSMGAHFLTGALATLMATPCSAPFLGTAVGFALSRGWVEIFLIFAALGVGLALPYLAVALVPGLATRMPRPGPWMVWLRRVMGLALLATAVWLATILAVQVNTTAAWLIVLLLAGVIIVFWLHRRMGRRFGRLEWLAVLGLALVALAVPDGVSERGPKTGTGEELAGALKGVWQPFDLAAIPTLVANGKTVFVDVTADWCITCQVNKAVSLSQGAALEKLKSENVVAMQADWTRPNDAISAYLASFGRYGIPFNAVYGPGIPAGKALPEILSQTIVIDAINAAGDGE